MSTPDVTPSQILSVILFAITEAVSNGYITNGTGKLVTDIAGAVIPIVWIAIDGHIRRGRAGVAAAQIAAAAAAAVATLPPPKPRARRAPKPATPVQTPASQVPAAPLVAPAP